MLYLNQSMWRQIIGRVLIEPIQNVVFKSRMVDELNQNGYIEPIQNVVFKLLNLLLLFKGYHD